MQQVQYFWEKNIIATTNVLKDAENAEWYENRVSI